MSGLLQRGAPQRLLARSEAAAILAGCLSLVGCRPHGEPEEIGRAAAALDAHEQQSLPGDGTPNDRYGSFVAIAGDTAFVGAPMDDRNGSEAGAVHVFTRSGGAFSWRKKLVADDGATGDLFGSVALSASGDTAVVGAYKADSGGNADSGAAYVFERGGGDWTQDQKLVPQGGAAGDLFGGSVAISDDTIVVGAIGVDVNGNADSGAAYVFVRAYPGSAWAQQAKIDSPAAGAGDSFGFSVAVAGDTAVIGADLEDAGGKVDSGAAYVFVRSGTTWQQQAKLSPWDSDADDLFGVSISIWGDAAVLGARKDDDNGANSGSAYVFTRSNGAWTQEGPKLLASDGATEDRFGTSVDIGEHAAVIGARKHDNGGMVDSGAAYAFVRSGDGWKQQQKLSPSHEAAGVFFGGAVALSGDRAVVGASADYFPNTDPGSGSAYVFALLGKPCASDGECLSGFCADAVCCDTACAGVCQACTATLKGNGLDGTCEDVAADTDPGGECSRTGCGTTCNGSGACNALPIGTPCGDAQSCSGSTLTNQDTCDGAGTCQDNGTVSCAPYLCVPATCVASCVADGDCAAGARCDGGACVASPHDDEEAASDSNVTTFYGCSAGPRDGTGRAFPAALLLFALWIARRSRLSKSTRS